MAIVDDIAGTFYRCEGGVHVPTAWLSILNAGIETRRIRALIDTGASYIIIPMALATGMLGMTPQQIRTSPNEITLSPVGHPKESYYGWQKPVKLSLASRGADSIIFPDAWVYVAEKTIDEFPALFGQFSGLQGRCFRHHNREQNRFWQLRHS